MQELSDADHKNSAPGMTEKRRKSKDQEPDFTDLPDLSGLKEVAAGDDAFVELVLNMFVENMPGDVISLSDAIKNKDLHTAGRMAHKMKPSLHLVGLGGLTPLLEKLETAKTPDGLKETGEEVVLQIYKTIEAVRKLLKK